MNKYRSAGEIPEKWIDEFLAAGYAERLPNGRVVITQAGRVAMTIDIDNAKCQMSILGMPAQVQVVLKIRIIADSIRDNNPDLEAYASRALDWWKAVMEDPIAQKAGEGVVAERLIAEFRKSKFFGKMLRGDAS